MTSLAAFSPRNSPPSRTLGACWVIYGIFRIAMAIWLAIFAPTATVMFGALLTRVPEPFSLMAAFHLLYLVGLIWAAACGIVGSLAGMALLAGRRAGSALVRLSAYLSVADVPLGTTLSIYTLTVLPPAVVTETSLPAQRAA